MHLYRHMGEMKNNNKDDITTKDSCRLVFARRLHDIYSIVRDDLKEVTYSNIINNKFSRMTYLWFQFNYGIFKEGL